MITAGREPPPAGKISGSAHMSSLDDRLTGLDLLFQAHRAWAKSSER
jgi:hypothetical protein